MTFMSAIDVGNDTRPVPPRGGKEPGRKQFIEKRNPAPVSGRAAHARLATAVVNLSLSPPASCSRGRVPAVGREIRYMGGGRDYMLH